jgi:chitinase
VLNYAFGNVNSEGKCFEVNQAGVGDAWADYQRPHPANESVDGVADAPGQALAGNFNQIKKLKAKYPRLRAQISLGGWTWSKYFSNAALTDASRKAFVSSCIDLYIKGNLPQFDGDTHGGKGAAAGVFDGIDIDWEWPGSEGNPGNVVRPEDKRNFTLMLAEFRRQLDALGQETGKHYTLTAFVAADPKLIDAGYEVKEAFKYLDFATVQGYDFHGTWENIANHQSAIFAPTGDPSPEKFSLDLAVRSYLERGVPARKLVAGVPFYGRGWTGVTNKNNGLFQLATGCASSDLDCGYQNYNKIKALQGFTTYRNWRAGFAWRFDGVNFWTFDDPQVMLQKTFYIRYRELGGVMIWSLDGDTADGELIRALHRGLS